MMTNWVEFDNAQDIATAAADTIQESARFAIESKGEFKLVLAGGSSPVNCYRILAERELDWDKWTLFFGDERCLGVEDAERNHQIVAATGLLEKVNRHFIIPAELGSIKGAELYQQQINTSIPFDMVLLGMGEDGHTASLFPGDNWQHASPGLLTIAVHNAPKAPAERISLSVEALQNCKQMLVLINGAAKREAIRQWQDGKRLPIVEVSDIEQATVFIEASLLK